MTSGWMRDTLYSYYERQWKNINLAENHKTIRYLVFLFLENFTFYAHVRVEGYSCNRNLETKSK